MAAQGVRFFLRMGSTVVLARLLTPQDFGLIAMVTVITGFVMMFKDMGLSMATVQRDEVNHAQISTLFWINVGLSLCVMLLTAALAPVIAWFYGEPRLVWVTLALASAFIFGGFTVQHQALLRRQMRFGTLAVIGIISMVVGIITAIIAALSGAGYWSLVLMQLATAITIAIGVWVGCDWRPGLFVRRSGIRKMLAFGGNLTGFLTACLTHFGIKSHMFFSPIARPRESTSDLYVKAMKIAFRRIDKIVATTKYVREGWELFSKQSKCKSLYPGIIKKIEELPEDTVRNSVLFWRNADYKNGADLAMEAFQELAPKYPDIRFVFAVRPHDVLEEKLLELESRVTNIDVHIYPYKEGVSLTSLLQKAFFVVQPFRSLSINPQMSILETLYAGVPVIATKIESNEEVIEDRQTGFLIPPNDKNALVDAIETLLHDRKLCDKMAENAWSKTKLRWNWESFGRGLLEIYENNSN